MDGFSQLLSDVRQLASKLETPAEEAFVFEDKKSAEMAAKVLGRLGIAATVDDDSSVRVSADEADLAESKLDEAFDIRGDGDEARYYLRG